MNVCLCSSFRDASGYLARYFAQVDALNKALKQRGDRLRVIAGEGDSTDCTRELLEQHLAEADYLTTLVDVTHGGPKYGSIVAARRFKQLAGLWNKIWSHIPKNYSAVLFLESDLVWEADTLLALVDSLEKYPAIAPMILAPRISPTFFRDEWAFRKDGRHFRHAPPYFDDDSMEAPGIPVQIDSAGSVLAIRGALARQLTWPEVDVIVGICRQLYEVGASVWLHPQLSVAHL